MPQTISHILVVEDDPSDLALLARLLRKFRAELAVARNGEDALNYLFPHGKPQRVPDLILLDLILPRMHGFDILSRIRGEERTRSIPVIVITNSTSEREAMRCYSVGIDAFLAKPVKLADCSIALS